MALLYSCCFWFSLRLGGILIGVFSLVQELLLLAACLKAYSQIDDIKEVILHWVNDMQLIYFQPALESVSANPEKFMTLIICFTCLYIILCLLFIYGAYTLNVLMMAGFIVVELLRLLMVAILVTTWLLILKENSMDIGLLIGASVSSGFILLGMFYLWLCAANLPIVINEIKRDEQEATINKLRELIHEYLTYGDRQSLNGFNSNFNRYNIISY